MKILKLNLATIFLGIIALMLSILVIFIGTGLTVAHNISKSEIIIEAVESQNNDTVVIVKD